MGTEVVDFEDIHAFKMSVKYNEITVKSRENTFEHHIHSECEIYLNISGDVSLRILSRCLKKIRHNTAAIQKTRRGTKNAAVLTRLANAVHSIK